MKRLKMSRKVAAYNDIDYRAALSKAELEWLFAFENAEFCGSPNKLESYGPLTQAQKKQFYDQHNQRRRCLYNQLNQRRTELIDED